MATLLQPKVALVTGASRGIGKAIALALAEQGATVALTARSADDLASVKAEIQDRGGQASCFVTDLSVEADVLSLVPHVVETLGRLDILVNNAGAISRGPLADTSAEDWDRVMTVNTRSVFLLCREAIPHLRRQAPSHIVNISSVLGHKGYPEQGAYTASKHALMGLTKVLAKELHADGIRVHTVSPGGVNTDMRPDVPADTLIEPASVADAVVFLLTQRENAAIDEIRQRRDAAEPWK